MMPKTTSTIKNRLKNVESSSQRVADKLKVNFQESMTKDQEINKFLTTMEETTNGDDLKDFFDQILLNQVTSEEDEKEIVSMTNEFSPSNQGQLVEILENLEQVILLVFDKPIESRGMVTIKFVLLGLEFFYKNRSFQHFQKLFGGFWVERLDKCVCF
jgi:hypothetical protein